MTVKRRPMIGSAVMNASIAAVNLTIFVDRGGLFTLALVALNAGIALWCVWPRLDISRFFG